jgi:hypothetical protein
MHAERERKLTTAGNNERVGEGASGINATGRKPSPGDEPSGGLAVADPRRG